MAGYGSGNGPSSSRRRGSAPENGAAPGDRLPPQNLEAEQGVLGSILLDNNVLHDVVPLLRPEDFYRDTHQLLYRTIQEIYDQSGVVDSITLSDELTRRGLYDRVGGDEALGAILNAVPHAANAKYYAQIVRQKSVVRELIAAANEILREGYANTHTSDGLLELAEQLVFNIAEDQSSGDTVQLSEIITTAMDRIAKRSEDRHPVTGVATGFMELDDITAGLQPAQLVILAARPSMGKTALALNICEHAAMERRIGVLFVSLEMGQMELAERLLCSRSEVDGHKLRTGNGLTHGDMKNLGDAYAQLRDAPIFIDDTPARNMLQITANARRLKMRQDIGLIVVDYIQLIDAENGGDSRQEQIARISRRLKTLARELQVPVIALSQLNRGVENREDKRPRMADLRESGAIEQDADLVLMLHRPEYYESTDKPGLAELIVAKNRNGATGVVKLTFLRNHTKFASYHEADPLVGSAF